jgi:hypothetical protein
LYIWNTETITEGGSVSLQEMGQEELSTFAHQAFLSSFSNTLEKAVDKENFA